MLPFLKPKAVAGVIMERRKADASKELANEDQGNQDLIECCERMIQAFSNKDAMAMAEAFQAAISAASASQSDESNTFEAQNIKAAE